MKAKVKVTLSFSRGLSLL